MWIIYRIHQFWDALYAVPKSEDLESIRNTLTPEMMTLFLQMHPSEQCHSIRMYKMLLNSGDTDQDLLTAALLHDIGKNRYPLSICERVEVVLANLFFPRHVNHWRQGSPSGWRRPFVVAEQHARWGAEMAADAGVSPRCADLICYHHQDNIQEESINSELSVINKLLHRLQFADNNS